MAQFLIRNVKIQSLQLLRQLREVVWPDIHLGNFLEEGEGGHGLDWQPEAGTLHLVRVEDIPEVSDVEPLISTFVL